MVYGTRQNNRRSFLTQKLFTGTAYKNVIVGDGTGVLCEDCADYFLSYGDSWAFVVFYKRSL